MTRADVAEALSEKDHEHLETYWSNTDFPYECLVDRARTSALMTAVTEVVRPGDTVVEAGAGTGILSLTAAAAGAGRVVAVEMNPLLAESLRAAADANGFADTIEVVEGDVRTADLPSADVVIAELIDTALIDETLVPVVNTLRERRVITENTRMLPAGYRTAVQLVHTDNRFYGYVIPVIRHEWPHYADTGRWETPRVTDVSPWQQVWQTDFTEVVDPEVTFSYTISLPAETEVNALRLGGTMRFGARWLADYPSLNGTKLIPVPAVTGNRFRVRGSWLLGAGLAHASIGIDPL
ncbi:50S ribosomal protein L11 methyltransferase [Millisia brevis]|uniref:50S ribosomal protein L11 methyltransferase n=1 Tax=Millisia brevis TaxID=264148 RepID=UPI0008363CA7|nr:50S ribosomal protein L11 methyltransferase [Millisia brevis]